MIFEVRAPQDEAKIVPSRVSEPLSSDFGREKSVETPCREACRATRGAQVARGGLSGSQVAPLIRTPHRRRRPILLMSSP